MAHLFLSSSFSDTYKQLPDFVGKELTNKQVIFIDTASHTEEYVSYVNEAQTCLVDLGLLVNRVDIYASDITSTIEAADFIYVSGGNTFYLMQELKKSGVDKLIIKHINKRKIYIGESAGSVIMSPNILYIKEMDDITQAPELTDYIGFNFIEVYPVPHVANPYLNEAVESILTTYQDLLKLHPFSDEETLLINT